MSEPDSRQNITESWQAFVTAVLGRSPSHQDVQPGATFRRRNYGDIVETARVVSVHTDSQQLPHVSFEITFRRRDGGTFNFGNRTLGLKTFVGQYREKIAS
jgi:hypothetical protein